MGDVALAFIALERQQPRANRQPVVRKLRQSRRPANGRLGGKQELQHAITIRLERGNFQDLVPGRRRQAVRLVDDQHRAVARGAKPAEKLIEHLDQLEPGGAGQAALLDVVLRYGAEVLEHQAQQVFG